MKILVTGGAGFTGSRTCGRLLALGHEVVVLNRMRELGVIRKAAE